MNTVRINAAFAASVATLSGFAFVLLLMPVAAINVLTGAV